MVSAVVTVLDQAPDLHFKIAWQVIVLQQYLVLERLMPTFDLSMRLRMIRRATDVTHALRIEPFSQFARDIAGAIV